MSPWLHYLLNITVYSSVIAPLLFLLYHRRFSTPLKYIGVFTIVKSLCEFIGSYLANIPINNLPVLHAYTFLEFMLIGGFFRALFLEMKELAIPKTILLLGCLLIIGNTLFVQTILTYNSYSKTGVNLVLLSLSFWALYYFTTKDYQIRYTRSIKLIVSALFLNYTSVLFLYLFSSHILDFPKNIQHVIWAVNPVINLIVQLVITIAFCYPIIPQLNKTTTTHE